MLGLSFLRKANSAAALRSDNEGRQNSSPLPGVNPWFESGEMMFHVGDVVLNEEAEGEWSSGHDARV